VSEHLLFWPKSVVAAYVTTALSQQVVYTQALPTDEFTESVGQLQCDTNTAHDGASDIHVKPQISDDGLNWETSSTLFAAIDQSGIFPKNETIKITTIGAFIRFKIERNEDPILGADGLVAGTLLIAGVGRS
jgi:hypothetical protein